MAELFGIVAGAIGITFAFTACVDCFEYVQLAATLVEISRPPSLLSAARDSVLHDGASLPTSTMILNWAGRMLLWPRSNLRKTAGPERGRVAYSLDDYLRLQDAHMIAKLLRIRHP
jgi:hypothetical protein